MKCSCCFLTFDEKDLYSYDDEKFRYCINCYINLFDNEYIHVDNNYREKVKGLLDKLKGTIEEESLYEYKMFDKEQFIDHKIEFRRKLKGIWEVI